MGVCFKFTAPKSDTLALKNQLPLHPPLSYSEGAVGMYARVTSLSNTVLNFQAHGQRKLERTTFVAQNVGT